MRVSAYTCQEGRLTSMDPSGDLSEAMWIDLFKPGKADYERIKELGILIPRLRDVEQIEPSQRLQRIGETEMITVLLSTPFSGTRSPGTRGFGPVIFLLHKDRLVTVRYHGEDLWHGFTLDNRSTPADVLVALLSLGMGHMADVIEFWDRALERLSQEVFEAPEAANSAQLKQAIRTAGALGDDLSFVRLNLLIIRRALAHLDEVRADGRAQLSRKQAQKRLDRDLEALTVHTDYLSGRVTLAIDATVGLISLAQNDNARIFSVVATIFLPATLIASIFGMNFDVMPLLHLAHGFDISLLLMGAAAAVIVLLFVYRRWL